MDISVKEAFNRIYSRGGWPGGRSDGTTSGKGSTMEGTAEARRFIVNIVRDFGVSSIFDAPCGDFHWMKTLRADIDIDYFGGDIADVIVSDLNEKYGDARTLFTYHDIALSPFIPSDLWICRDCLFHLPTPSGVAALENFCRSNTSYALITTHRLDANRELNAAGSFRPLDLTKAPFNLPDPILSCRETDDGRAPRYLGFWSRSQIVKARAAAR